LIQLILGDSIRVMEGMAAAGKFRFDMIFVDPPYFEWPEAVKPDHSKLSYLVYELLKPRGVVWLCGTQPQLLKDWPYWDRLFDLVFELIAYKTGGTPPLHEKAPIRIHENIWCLKRKRDNISDLKLDMTKAAGKATERERGKGSGMQLRAQGLGEGWTDYRGRYPKSVMLVPRIDAKSKEYEGHPAQKPLRLMEFIVKVSTDEDDWILDPFSGVATTLVAAQELNRNAIGIEINPEYIRLSRRRFERIRQLKKLERWIT
jgi:DNA modification methylase